MKLELLETQLGEKKAEHQKVTNELRKLQWEYDDAIDKPRKQKLIGTFYKYRNNYSCPEKPSDYWWLYIHVTGLKGTMLIGNTFQTDKYGKCEFEKERVADSVIAGAKKITKAEYIKALNKFSDKLARLSL
jgi:hypothetical protein